MVTPPTGASYKVPATQAELDRLGVSIDVKQFVDGTIRRCRSPSPAPTSGSRSRPRDSTTESMVKGTIEGVDIIVFILVLGGLIGVVNATGAFNAGLVALSKKAQGNEFRSCSSPRCVR